VSRLVIMLRDAIYLPRPGKPQARSGARWDRLDKHGDEYQEAFVRLEKSQTCSTHSGAESELVRDHLPLGLAIPAAIKSLNHSRGPLLDCEDRADLKELSSAALLAGRDSKNPDVSGGTREFPRGRLPSRLPGP